MKPSDQATNKEGNFETMARGKSGKSTQEVTPKTEGERAKALDMAMKQIEKQFGKGAILRMGEDQHIETQTIPSGCCPLTSPSGSAAYPKAVSSRSTVRKVPVRRPSPGMRSPSGQKQGGIAALIDAEHALDPVYAEKIGVDIDNLLISSPTTGNRPLEICEALPCSGSGRYHRARPAAALVPKAEIDGEMGDVQVGCFRPA